MLRQSFIFLQKISEKKEKNIWGQGIEGWNDFLDACKIKGISKKTKFYYDKKIKDAKKAFVDCDAEFFANNLPKPEHWRAYSLFKDEAVFLDIETGRRGEITVIGMHDGYETKTMIKGFNLDKKRILCELKKYKMVVTFNGKTFDMPCIEKYFGLGSSMHPFLHVDLMHACRKVGLSGGLKQIEKKMGIKRSEKLCHVKGQEAAELWRCWLATGDKYFLKLLVMYNEEDCVNLKMIADIVIEKLWKKTKGLC